MFEFRSAPHDDAAPQNTASADTGSRDAAKRPASSPLPRVDPVQFRLPGSYSMDGMTAIPPGVFPAPELCPPHHDNPSAAGQHQVSSPDKPSSKAR